MSAPATVTRPAAAAQPTARREDLLVERFDALGTTAVVAVVDPAGLEAALRAVHATVERFDRSCSRFRDDSTLTAVNRAAGRWVAVDATLLDALGVALRAADLTDGDVDPTIGGALVALGYDRSFEGLDSSSDAGPALPVASPRPTRRALPQFAAVPGWRAVELDLAAGRVRIPRGVRLDLGATAKARCADVAAEAATRAAGCGVLVSLGGDIALGGEPPEGGWHVRVADDHRAAPDAPGQTIRLSQGGLATSSTTVRRWTVAEPTTARTTARRTARTTARSAGGPEPAPVPGPRPGQLHHVLDPRTGRPTRSPWRTVSVAAANCVDANVAATAAIVRGEEAPAWLTALGLPSRLVASDGRIRHLAGWPPDGEELARR